LLISLDWVSTLMGQGREARGIGSRAPYQETWNPRYHALPLLVPSLSHLSTKGSPPIRRGTAPPGTKG